MPNIHESVLVNPAVSVAKSISCQQMRNLLPAAHDTCILNSICCFEVKSNEVNKKLDAMSVGFREEHNCKAPSSWQFSTDKQKHMYLKSVDSEKLYTLNNIKRFSRHALLTTALQAKHCWTDMARMFPTRLRSKPRCSFVKVQRVVGVWSRPWFDPSQLCVDQAVTQHMTSLYWEQRHNLFKTC